MQKIRDEIKQINEEHNITMKKIADENKKDAKMEMLKNHLLAKTLEVEEFQRQSKLEQKKVECKIEKRLLSNEKLNLLIQELDEKRTKLSEEKFSNNTKNND